MCLIGFLRDFNFNDDEFTQILLKNCRILKYFFPNFLEFESEYLVIFIAFLKFSLKFPSFQFPPINLLPHSILRTPRHSKNFIKILLYKIPLLFYSLCWWITLYVGFCLLLWLPANLIPFLSFHINGVFMVFYSLHICCGKSKKMHINANYNSNPWIVNNSKATALRYRNWSGKNYIGN